jgi:predicted TIM-barrel fold metal-dependent hydrolase
MRIIDADTHLGEPKAMWDMLDERFYARRPVVASIPNDTLYGGKNAFWVIDGHIYPKSAGKGSHLLMTPSEQEDQQVRKDIPLGSRELTDPAQRLREMDQMEVAVEVVYPTLFLVYLTEDVELEVALCQAYNRYLASVWKQSGGRLRWVAIPPLRDVKASVAQLREAKEGGAAGVFFRGIEGDRTLNDPYFFPVYEAAERLDMPIAIHTGAGCPKLSNIFDVQYNSTYPHLRTLPMLAFRDLVANRVMEEFPRLRVGFIEAGASWVPHIFHILRRQNKLNPSLTPPEVCRELRLFVACETDEDIPYLIDYVGEDNLLIGSDYGHRDQSYEAELVPQLKAREDLPAGFLDKLLDRNPAAFYAIR